MAIRREKESNGEYAIVIDGFENGIADSPFDGLSDMRNVSISTVPKEVSVAFQTYKTSYPTVSGTLVSADASGDTVTISGGTVENGMSVTFAGGSLPSGIVAGTVYWCKNVSGGTVFQLGTTQSLAAIVDITSNGTGTFVTFDMAKPTYGCHDQHNNFYYIVDANGYVWGNNRTTIPSGYWTFLGNTTVTNANGNGIQCYEGSNGNVWIFVFRNAAIDYVQSQTNLGAWVFGWNPSSGGSGSSSLNNAAGVNNPHYSLVGQDNTLYYTDASYLGSFFENTGKNFDPTDTSTFTWAKQALALPKLDTAQCLAELGTNLLTGGVLNRVYLWDRVSTTYSSPILIAENNVARMVTVNTNTYIFAGVRGRIYITNGSQAQFFKKIPDHLSGTVTPYFMWGDACFHQNRLFFGIQATTNSGTANNNYGGVWGIELGSGALYYAVPSGSLFYANQLSYGTYAGKATVLLPDTGGTGTSVVPATPLGLGMYVGWDSGSSTYGMDASFNPTTNVSAPYSSGQAYIDSDLIPIGTFLKPVTDSQLEFKLTTPLVSGESVQLLWRQKFSDSYTSMGTDSTAGDFANYFTANFQNSQWIQIRAVLTSTSTNPSYTRLKELRIR